MCKLEKGNVALFAALWASDVEEEAGRRIAYRRSKIKVSNISRTISMVKDGERQGQVERSVGGATRTSWRVMFSTSSQRGER